MLNFKWAFSLSPFTLIKRFFSSLCFLTLYIAHLQLKERGLTRNQPCWHLDLGSPASRTVRNPPVSCEPLLLWQLSLWVLLHFVSHIPGSFWPLLAPAMSLKILDSFEWTMVSGSWPPGVRFHITWGSVASRPSQHVLSRTRTDGCCFQRKITHAWSFLSLVSCCQVWGADSFNSWFC